MLILFPLMSKYYEKDNHWKNATDITNKVDSEAIHHYFAVYCYKVIVKDTSVSICCLMHFLSCVLRAILHKHRTVRNNRLHKGIHGLAVSSTDHIVALKCTIKSLLHSSTLCSAF